MKIVHICLACSYVEGWGYQENILPKMHKELGHDVTVITSDFAFNSKGEQTKKNEKDYVNERGVHVIVLERTKGYLGIRLKEFRDLYNVLTTEKPDVIFVHGGQFIGLRHVVNYCKKHSIVKLYIDQHGDYYNTPVNNLKRLLTHKVIFGYWMRRAIPYTSMYWGVTPWRCQYLHDVYGIPETSIGLLVMGGDDEHINLAAKNDVRAKIRSELRLNSSDFVVITGGKIDRTKKTDLLMKSVQEINRPDVKLIVFGQPNKDMEKEILELADSPSIRYIGWIDSNEVYDYFLASDLAFFPGTHSVLWEQAASCGIPMIVQDWEGMHHIDVGGNCRFVSCISVEDCKEALLELLNNSDEYADMRRIAETEAVNTFSYRSIAKRAIEEG